MGPRALASSVRRWEWLGMLVVAFALRVAAGIHLGHFADPFPWEYEEIATNLVEGNGYLCHYLDRSYWALCMPGYPFLCAAVYAVTHHNQTILLLLQCLLGALICLPVRQIGRLALSHPACAVLGSWAVALHPGLIQFSSRLHTLTVDTLLFLLCLWSWMAFHREPTLRRAAVTGLVSGIALLFRGTILPFLFLAAVLSPRFSHLPLRALAPRLARIGLIAGLLLAPWLARNAVRFGEFPVFITTSNLALWIGNNPHTAGGSVLPEGGAVQGTIRGAFLDELQQKDEMGQSRLFGLRAREFIRGHPLRALQLYGMKLRSFFWFSPQTGRLYPARHLKWYRWYYTGVVALALAGLWALRRRLLDPPLALLLVYVFSIALFQSLYFVDGRHRWTVEPVFLLWAAQGAVSLKRRIPCAFS